MHTAKLVFVVDDDASVRASLSSLVRSIGCTARTFDSGESLLALSSSEILRADCVICDVQMPGMNGIDLRDALYEHHCKVHFIFLTAHISDELRAAALAGGALCVLDKPADPDILFLWLSRAFDSSLPNRA